MSKKRLFPAMLAALAMLSAATARADLTVSTPAKEEPRGSSRHDQGSNRRLIERFRAAQLSLPEALAIAEHLHPGSRTASVSFEPSASPAYRVLTVRENETWEEVIDADSGRAAGPETMLSLRELDEDDRSNLIALRSVKQELSDAVRVAEKAASGKALGGSLLKQDGRLNFVIIVMSGDSLKEVMLEPPKAGHRGSDKYHLSQP